MSMLVILLPFWLCSTQAIRDMFEMVNICARVGSEHLAAEVARRGSDKQGAEINLCELTSHITLDIIGRFAFDHDFECGKSEASQRIASSWKAQVDLGFQKAGLIVSNWMGRVHACR